MRLFRNRAKTVLSRRHRDRFRLTLESLEGRQLMAASLLASTLDGVGNPVDVAIQTGGSVVVNMERATNDPSLPYQYTGYQTLPGLTANSIAATTLPDGSPIVVAMTNTQSFLYVNEYAPTGNDAVPRAWTGWQQLSNFVATSVTASTDGDTPGFFAIGANAQVFASFNDSSVTPTDIASSFTDFAPLSNLAVASIAVEPDPDGGYEVAALTGTHTFVYGNTVTPDGTGLTDTGWQQLGNFVATSINVTPGLNTTAFGGDLGDRLFLFAAGTDGNLYYNPLTANFDADTRDSTTYTSIGGGNIVGSKATVADGYLTVYKLTSDGYVVSQELVATGLSANPISPQYQSYLNQDDLYDPTTGSYHESPTFVATELVTTPVRGGGFDILARDSTGANQVDRFGPHDALDFPGYSVIYKSGNGFTDLATRAVHAVATTTAVGGLPIVVSLGSDGSVYYVAEQTAATSSAAATYATLTLIPDLTATSIAVTSLPATAGTGFVVFALTGAQSAIYENEFFATGDPTNPYNATGWSILGSDVATAIAAASPTGATSTDQATVFAIGVNGVVSATGATFAGADPSGAVSTPLEGLAASSISTKAIGSQILVAAMTNTISYAYANLYTPESAGILPPAASTGWTLTGTYVLSRATATVDVSGNPVVAGTSPFGYQAVSLSTNIANAPSTSPNNYIPINFEQVSLYPTQNGISREATFATLRNPATSGTTTGVAYIALIVPDNSPEFINYAYNKQSNGIFISTNSGTTTKPVTPPSFLPIGQTLLPTPTPLIRSLAVATSATATEYYIVDHLGNLYVSQATATNDPTNPLTFSSYQSIGTLPTSNTSIN